MKAISAVPAKPPAKFSTQIESVKMLRSCPVVASKARLRCEALAAIPALEYDSDKGGEDVLKTVHMYDDVGDELRYGLQDMLGTSKVPMEVRRAEVAAEIVLPGTTPTAEQMTELAMAMRKFQSDERNKPKRRGRWSVR